MSEQKGLIVNVYRTPGYNCTNGGVTAMHDTVLLIGEGIAEVFEAQEGQPVLKLVKRNIGGCTYLHAEPVERGRSHYMAGGNFVYTSDSRFPNMYPVSMHDRTEG